MRIVVLKKSEKSSIDLSLAELENLLKTSERSTLFRHAHKFW